ncbi:MAG: DUF2993 domain-containing protein [Veillonella sp.]|uniref:LmeA family phospholipid-binding protein n=1 Tax=Veillonella sp. TaxID=1926307 RepID=UPI0025DDEE21|nr:DUF2993 domain-containing protein [Veillonella sp.]MBS4912664.1 DUF2993 domain-containing protein [Veillonella sp.]
MKKLFITLLVVVVAILVAAQLLLPNFVKGQLEQQINSKLNPNSTTLHVESSPAVQLLWGDIDALRGELEGVTLGHLTFADVHLDVKEMKLNPVALLFNHQVEVTQMGSGQIEGTVTESDLQTFMEKSIKGLQISKVNITSDGIDVVGNVDMGFIKGTANIKGKLEIKNNSLVFSPQRFEINGASIGGLTASVLKQIVIYDFADFPIPVKADRIETINGELHLFVSPQTK